MSYGQTFFDLPNRSVHQFFFLTAVVITVEYINYLTGLQNWKINQSTEFRLTVLGPDVTNNG